MRSNLPNFSCARIKRYSKKKLFVSFIFTAIIYCFINFYEGESINNALHRMIATESKSVSENCEIYLSKLTNSLSNDYYDSNEVSGKQKILRFIRDYFYEYSYLTERVRNIRIYNQCVLHSELPKGLNMIELESKLFPMFTNISPSYRRWNGEVIHFPKLEEHGSFWAQFQRQVHGKGIVLSASNYQVDELKRLIKVLRFLGNELPIQIIHRGDLVEQFEKELIAVSRDDVTLVLKGNRNEKISSHKQDVWFVNTIESISAEYSNKFQRFANKWIAAIFNSFDEMILMDTDTIPFLNPEELLELLDENTNSFFFKDRFYIDEFANDKAIKFLLNLVNKNYIENDVFGIKSASDINVNNSFFQQNYRNYMESGLVLMKKSRTLGGLLLSVNLQLSSQLRTQVHGDKEFFWLGQLVSLKGNFKFNKFPSFAIGELKEEQNDENNFKVCSTQIAHFSEDKRLLWLNGGLKTCKKNSANYDMNINKKSSKLKEKYETLEELQAFYDSNIKIDGAILPGSLSRENLFRKKPFGNNKAENWSRDFNLGCAGYFWCASHKEQKDKDEQQGSPEGILIRFSSSEIDYIDEVIRIWNF